MSDYIPEDTICLILKHLPAKSLLRFRSVSRKWKEIINSPFFIRKHLSLQKPLFLAQDEASPRFMAVDPHGTPSIHIHTDPVQRGAIKLMGTHHGVVCLLNGSNLVVWNPSIRKSFTLPVPWVHIHEHANCLGFWMNPSTKQFKCIALVSKVNSLWRELKGVLYSSVGHEWREFRREEMNNWGRFHADNSLPVMIQGVAYWRGYIYNKHGGLVTVSRVRGPKPHPVVLSFDFALEKFDYVEIPDLQGPLLCQWQGGLAIVCRDEQCYEIKRMYLRQDGLWVNMFSFCIEMPGVDMLLWVMGNEERVRVLVKSDPGLALWDTRDGVIPLLDEPFEFKVYYRDQVTYDFVESILFPNLIVSEDPIVTHGMT